MSERLRQAIAKIIGFIRELKTSGDRARPIPCMIGAFHRDAHEEEKRNRDSAEDFCNFYKEMDEWHTRGSNIYGTGANKYDMGKGLKNAAYRVLVYFDKKNNIMVFISIYPKDDEKRVLNKEGQKGLKKLVDEIKAGKIELISLA